MANCVCQKCGKTMSDKNFYTYRDGTKMELCKACLTMHIDNFNPDTFLWALEKADVPYVEEEWNKIRDKAFAKDPYKMNGMSVFGKYVSKMKLSQWIRYHWCDTERLRVELDEAKRAAAANQAVLEKERKSFEEELLQKKESGEISDAEYKTYMSTETQNEMIADRAIQKVTAQSAAAASPFMQEEDLVDLGAELTEDDKMYLAMKWGRLYKPSEWVLLEEDYKKMEESFDIQDADTANTLVLICKTNLKMNQAIDMRRLRWFPKIIKGIRIFA